MSTLDKTILKKCLLESTLNEIREIEAIDYSHIKADESFKDKILNTINGAERESAKARSKRITISLIAAIIICFSIMLSVSAKIRTAVVDFFVEIYDSFAVFFIENEECEDASSVIDTVYEPAYFSENGYEQLNKTQNDFRIFTVWSKDGIIVDLSQHIIDKNDIILDAEDMSYEVTYIGDKVVYYTIKNDIYFVKWLEYGYSFNLSCDASLGWEEIEKIISSLQPINE